VESALSRTSDHITRVEVHLSDENSNKKGGNDNMRCVMEARLEGRRPIAVTREAATLDQAVDGAADKLSRMIESNLGRLRDQKSHRTDPPPPGVKTPGGVMSDTTASLRRNGTFHRLVQGSLVLMIALLSLPVLQGFSSAASGLIGSPAPYFRVESGDDKELTLDMIKGKVAAIFYQNKDIVDANKRLKDELQTLYYEQTGIVKDVLVRLPIIDCSDALWLFRGMWKREIREYSMKEGTTIYCDWNGKMSSDYGMKADVSNVVIIDKGGKIRFFTSGEIEDEDIRGVKELLIVLATE